MVNVNVSLPRFQQNADYITTWHLETRTDIDKWQNWIIKHETSFYVCALAYVALAFLGQHLMTKRKPFRLRNSLAFWNFSFGLFSTIGFLRTAPELLHILKQENGFYHSACSVEYVNPTTKFWAILMILSKFIELGDTAFIVLNKKPLTFLNWGHHSLTLCLTVAIGTTKNTNGRWFMIMNLFVHALMYTYFGLKTLNLKIPRQISVCITVTQITQLFIGAIVAGYSLSLKLSGVECHLPIAQAYAGFALYFVLVCIFTRFFVKAYLPALHSKSITTKVD